ncbi:MAG: hypothetical protein ACFCU1_04150 [Sumerlaeia bacterium]
MARTILANKNILVLGSSSAPGRGAVLQLCREGAKVTLCDSDTTSTEKLSQLLHKKKAESIQAHLPVDKADWEELLVKARDFSGHYHMVVNAHALTYGAGYSQDEAEADALKLNEMLIRLLKDRGPLKMISLWDAERPLDADYGDQWHAWLLLEAFQRLEEEQVKELDDQKGVPHLRAGAIADSVVMILQLPPSACPEEVHLKYVPSSEKKA